MRQSLTLLLMLLLLITQQASLSHAVQDFAPAPNSAAAEVGHQGPAADQQESDSHTFELCGLAAQFSAAIPASILRLAPLSTHGFVRHALRTDGYQATPWLVFQARAPPLA